MLAHLTVRTTAIYLLLGLAATVPARPQGNVHGDMVFRVER